ncbi:AfsR/SARP family transcriptional regulator [Sphingomicrobium lutaoense]|uniref:DNA-binding SARP family transcriptional activator n=1 Tax=Sphingomicrobium lutaoense TaxID=515949 RepID=A0A839Z2W4_9SPHN|nr:BTAD domain-containing putative transcriptional regulator [Sphingomicrobium lutaoense]MBB3764093.1 DNA-binding SARP family transcriptional activator [Sphingomicrobium lutaoense]
MPSRGERWQVHLIGSFRLTDLHHQSDATPGSRKACAVLAYLASRPGETIARERLAGLLWGDRAEPQARASLRQAIFDIRRASDREAAPIVADRFHVRLDQHNVRMGGLHDAERADSEWQPFEDLDGISPEFDDWLSYERMRIRDMVVAAAVRELRGALSAGLGGRMVALVRRLQRLEPLNEEFVRYAMLAHYQAGQSAQVERDYRDYCARLERELAVSPSGATRQLRDELMAALARQVPAHRVEPARS